jgi:hypothetical protein
VKTTAEKKQNEKISMFDKPQKIEKFNTQQIVSQN